MKEADGRIFSGKLDRYKSVLEYAFGDCPILESKIEKTSFTHKNMIDITKKYHYVEDTYPGYYVNVGLQFKPFEKRDQYVMFRMQFESARYFINNSALFNTWSGVIGYTF